jgi:hypothetical protein
MGVTWLLCYVVLPFLCGLLGVFAGVAILSAYLADH